MSESAEDETQAGEEAAGSGKKKLIIIIAAVAVLLLGGGGGAAYFLGFFGGGSAAEEEMLAEDGHGEEHGHAEDDHGDKKDDHAKKDKKSKDDHGKEGEVAAVHFVDLPDVLVNLRSESRRMRFLKLRIALEASDEETATNIKSLIPRIMDSFQLYLRALSVDDVKGTAGLQQMKMDLVARINQSISPVEIEDVLIKEMLVQ